MMYDHNRNPIALPMTDSYGRAYACDINGTPYLIAGYAPVAPPQPYGGPGPQSYGAGGNPAPPGPDARARVRMDTLADMSNAGESYRAPFFPTSPFMSTSRNIGYVSRIYTASVSYTDTDYAVGSEMLRPVRFDLPCRIIAFNGAAFPVDPDTGNAFPVGIGPRACWLFRSEYSNNEKMQTTLQIAENVVGTAQRPGELGGVGWSVDTGGTLQVSFVPLLPGLRIDLSVVCLEMRGSSNFTRGI